MPGLPLNDGSVSAAIPTVGARLWVKRISAPALEFSVLEIPRSPVPKARPYVSPGWSGGSKTTVAEPWVPVRLMPESPNGAALPKTAALPSSIPDGPVIN